MSLKDVVANRVLEDILGKLYKENSWKVLVLDSLSTRIISACCKMHDVMSKGITLVEALEKGRQPLPHLEAVYIIIPNDSSIQTLIRDFSGDKPLYKAAHIFFLEKCSTSLFSKLGASKVAKKIVTLQEANMAFLPYESRVFTLDYSMACQDFYAPGSVGKGIMAERIADQLATVCAMLGEYPAIRYRSEPSEVVAIAEAVQTKLDGYKAEKRELGSGPEKSKSQLIILDRGFDVITPLLHELTYQAMVYDLLTVKNDVFMYRAATGDDQMKQREVILDENDEIWVELRHQHIADVSKIVAQKFQDFAQKKKLKHAGDPDVSIKDLARHIKRVPQYQKELRGYSLHINMVDNCLRKFRASINNLCKVEQNLALGVDSQGDPIGDPMKDIMPCLFNKDIKAYDKIRLLMIFILYKKGVSRDDFIKLMQHSEIPQSDRKILLNLMHLGYTVLTEENVKGPKKKLQMKERPGVKYEVSRWTPLIQDIAEYAAADNLDDGYCPWLRSKPRPSSSVGAVTSGASAADQGGVAGTGTSVRQRWNWIPKQGEAGKGGVAGGSGAQSLAGVKKTGPTIILFIVGGMTYSEMRAAYEAADATGHHIIIGSTSILPSNEFLAQLKDMKPLVTI